MMIMTVSTAEDGYVNIVNNIRIGLDACVVVVVIIIFVFIIITHHHDLISFHGARPGGGVNMPRPPQSSNRRRSRRRLRLRSSSRRLFCSRRRFRVLLVCRLLHHLVLSCHVCVFYYGFCVGRSYLPYKILFGPGPLPARGRSRRGCRELGRRVQLLHRAGHVRCREMQLRLRVMLTVDAYSHFVADPCMLLQANRALKK